MKRLPEVTGLPLQWMQPSAWREAYELRAGDDLAVFHNNTWDGGGTLEFTDGRRYLASTNFWQTRYELQTDAGEPLVRFDIGGVFRQSAGVIVQPAAVRLADLPLLITLGWYLAVMMHQDSSAAAVVVAA